MSRLAMIPVLAALACMAMPARSVAGPALPISPFAQRVIEREWGQSEDSVYVEVDVPGLKSEALATSLSAILPGAGQLYVEERSGWLFLTLEAAGWGGWWWYRHESHRLNDDAAGIAGPPDAAGSAWSYDRWVSTTDGDPGPVAQLYAVDRDAFYNAIGSDPAYAAGWSNAQAQVDFVTLRDRADERMRSSRGFSTALWFNHLLAAVDAMRAARFHNLPINRSVGLNIGHRRTGGAPAVAMAVEVKF
jgi:hypothetical protein